MNEEWSDSDKKWAKEVLTCRQIVSEISRFGVSDNQRLKIIELLALEIENRDDSLSITSIAKGIIERREIGTSEERRILT
jgi:hypothetical protein